MHKFPGDVVSTSLLLLRMDVHKTIHALSKSVDGACLKSIYIRKNRVSVTHTMTQNTCS